LRPICRTGQLAGMLPWWQCRPNHDDLDGLLGLVAMDVVEVYCPMMKRVYDREGSAAVCRVPPRLFRRAPRAKTVAGLQSLSEMPLTFHSLERERPPS
jgi:hypothetical protein